MEDSDEIDAINQNIIKSMSRKLKDELNIKENDLLLLSDNIIVNESTIKYAIKMQKKIFVFLADLNLLKTVVW